MPDWAQIISDALDILKFDGAVQDTLAELREKWGAQVPALLDERFDAVGVQYMKLSHEKGAAALGQELSAFGWALYNLDDEDEYLFALIPEEERSEWERYCKKQGQYCHLMKQQGRKWGDHAKEQDPGKLMPCEEYILQDEYDYFFNSLAGDFAAGEWKNQNAEEWKNGCVADLRHRPPQVIRSHSLPHLGCLTYSPEHELYAASRAAGSGTIGRALLSKNPAKFQDEAYLFIPFDENYYQAMAKVMEKRFANWQGQSFDEATLEPSDLAEAMMEYLDCECTYFPSMTDDDPIMSAYNYAKRESVKEGFVPVLIKADDEILWECLIMNSNPDSDGEDDFAFDPDKVAEYRKKMLSAPVENSKAVLEEMIGQRKEEAEDDDMDWDEEILGEMEGGYDNRRFSSYWNSDNNMTYPLILAKIPVKNPWEIFAYLPFGGWNECPDTPELMAVAKYWFEQHGAVPAAMSHDELEFLLPAPVSEKEAIDVAVELYGFCPDVIDQGPEDATVGALADVLRQSTVWYFWWD